MRGQVAHALIDCARESSRPAAYQALLEGEGHFGHFFYSKITLFSPLSANDWAPS